VKGGVKVLGRGEITKKLTLKVAAISGSARSKIEAAGGSVELHQPAPSRAVVRRGQGKSKES
jgi:ribosomal protein L15